MENAPRLAALDDFLTALRFEGIPIGPQELVWLQHAFALAPALDRHSLHDLLACTLIKQAAHRDIFETLFADWCQSDDSPDAAREPQSAAPVSTVPNAQAPEATSPPLRSESPTPSKHRHHSGAPGAPGCLPCSPSLSQGLDMPSLAPARQHPDLFL